MPTFKLNRRTVLRGALGGAAIGFTLPPLEAMFNTNGTAYAQGGAAIPKRLGIFFWGNGVRPNQWIPDDVGQNWTPSIALAPLRTLGVQEYVNVVSGMDIHSGAERGHHCGTVGILSGAPLLSQPANGAPYRSTFSKPSIDQVAAGVIGTKTPFRSLELGISNRVNSVEGTTLRYLSHNGPDSANPPDYDVARVFNRVFGMGFKPPTVGPAAPIDLSLTYRKSILDVVKGDLDRLKGRVGTADKTRLDQHLENVRTIENRLTPPAVPAMVGQSCKVPAVPNNFADMQGREMLEEKTKAMSDLLAIVLACDQTRVFSMMFTGSVASTVFWQVNVNTGHHQLTHDERGIQPQVNQTTIFTVKMFATLLASLKNTPEGAGNVLDNCAILASTDTSDGKFHNIKEYPILVAGRAGGALKYPGIHYRSPTAENTSKVLLTMLRAVGTNLNSAGGGPGIATESCGAIEA